MEKLEKLRKTNDTCSKSSRLHIFSIFSCPLISYYDSKSFKSKDVDNFKILKAAQHQQ